MIDHRTGIDEIILLKPVTGGSLLHQMNIIFYQICLWGFILFSCSCGPLPIDKVEVLIDQMNGSDLLDASDAVDELIDLADDPRVIPAFIDILSDPNSQMSGYVSCNMKKLGEPAIPYLLKAIDNPSAQNDAIFALIWMDTTTPEVINKIINLIYAENADILFCLSFIGKFGDNNNDISELIAEYIMSEDELVRFSACKALIKCEYRTERIFNALLDILNIFTRWEKRVIGIKTIAYLSPVPDYLTNSIENLGWKVSDQEEIWISCVLNKNDESQVDELNNIINYLSSDDIEVVVAAAEALSVIGANAKSAIPELESALSGWERTIYGTMIREAIEKLSEQD